MRIKLHTLPPPLQKRCFDSTLLLIGFRRDNLLVPSRLWFLWPEEAGIRNKRSRNRCGCLGGCRFFGGTNMGLDFFKLEELTPSSSSAFSSSSTESDMSYGQSLLQPSEWIITKETPKVDGGKCP